MRSTGIPAFWHNLRHGKSVQTDVPLQRWDGDALHDPEGAMGKAYVRAAAFCQAEPKLLRVYGSAKLNSDTSHHACHCAGGGCS